MLRARLVAAAAAGVLAALMVSGSPLTAQQLPAVVNMRDFAFEPRDLMVVAGTTVRWVNRDGAPHSVAMEGGRPGSSRGPIAPGGEHSAVFREAGLFVYRCGIHPTMLGEVTVTAP